MRPNYSANLTDVAGTVSAMSAEQAGDIAVAAKVDRTAPVEIKGRLQPFAAELSLDLTGSARDIELPPLTPYAAKYAGYGIEKGKLSFDAAYKVENRKLVASNKLVLDQLTFGARVDSPDRDQAAGAAGGGAAQGSPRRDRHRVADRGLARRSAVLGRAASSSA